MAPLCVGAASLAAAGAASLAGNGASCSTSEPQRGLRRAASSDERHSLQQSLQRILDQSERTGGIGELTYQLSKLEDELFSRGRVHRVVITGGPCAGKSTIMSDLILMLKERNFLVFTMPEIATEMYRWSDGKMWDDFSVQGADDDRVWASLQTTLTRVQMVIEDSIVEMAHRSLARRRKEANPPEGVVVLLDRGVVDNVAYCVRDRRSRPGRPSAQRAPPVALRCRSPALHCRASSLRCRASSPPEPLACARRRPRRGRWCSRSSAPRQPGSATGVTTTSSTW